jgi:DNA-binding MarR family transcriptional regulator
MAMIGSLTKRNGMLAGPAAYAQLRHARATAGDGSTARLSLPRYAIICGDIFMKNNHRSGPLEASALHLLHRAGQCAEVLFSNEAGKSDLTPRQYAILSSVSQQPDISQTGLVEQTGVDRSTLADIVRRLVKKGLLQRKRTRRDARMYAVRLTHKGQSALSQLKPAAARVDQRLLAALKADQRSGFIDALGEIVRAMNRAAAHR